jgi:cytochrome c oxidase cbb3-type subunit 2
MNHAPLLVLGIFAALSTSWFGLVVWPQIQLGHLKPVEVEETGQIYPSARSGLAEQGADVYRASNCAACHTQQVRPGTDIARGWGARRTVAQDYLFDEPLMLGSLRVGPDLANIGARQLDDNWHLVHLYKPRLVAETSVMPSYRFLFTKRALGAQPSPHALKLPLAEITRLNGHEIVPKPEALALVAYLRSLRADAPLFEAPLPAKPSPQKATLSAPSTNSPAKK